MRTVSAALVAPDTSCMFVYSGVSSVLCGVLDWRCVWYTFVHAASMHHCSLWLYTVQWLVTVVCTGLPLALHFSLVSAHTSDRVQSGWRVVLQ